MVSSTLNGSDDGLVIEIEQPKIHRAVSGLIGFRGFQLQNILNPEASRINGERAHKDALTKCRNKGVKAPAGAMQRATLQTAAGRSLLDMQQKPAINFMNELAAKFGLAVRSKEFDNKPEWRIQPFMEVSAAKLNSKSTNTEEKSEGPAAKRLRVVGEKAAEHDPTSVLFPEQCNGCGADYKPYRSVEVGIYAALWIKLRHEHLGDIE
ncbi:serine threonine-protein phosphatase [Perkinsus chesapeaki]|uniref:Serine threonine-protein phosphatase n=1 Tax=Perkinsus chesapeaki TaxID=330153 RepID=A0A7J6L906_PERCH|nr:serine threonine-protein phosphatase [Perkinsus chesapeaki]